MPEEANNHLKKDKFLPLVGLFCFFFICRRYCIGI